MRRLWQLTSIKEPTFKFLVFMLLCSKVSIDEVQMLELEVNSPNAEDKTEEDFNAQLLHVINYGQLGHIAAGCQSQPRQSFNSHRG